MLIVTKGDTGPVALYRAPGDLRAGSTAKLERVGAAQGGERQQGNEPHHRRHGFD